MLLQTVVIIIFRFRLASGFLIGRNCFSFYLLPFWIIWWLIYFGTNVIWGSRCVDALSTFICWPISGHFVIRYRGRFLISSFQRTLFPSHFSVNFICGVSRGEIKTRVLFYLLMLATQTGPKTIRQSGKMTPYVRNILLTCSLSFSNLNCYFGASSATICIFYVLVLGVGLEGHLNSMWPVSETLTKQAWLGDFSLLRHTSS